MYYLGSLLEHHRQPLLLIVARHDEAELDLPVFGELLVLGCGVGLAVQGRYFDVSEVNGGTDYWLRAW